MQRSHRYITSLFMAALYLLITFSPLAPLAMHSKRVAHAVTGECSGDCQTCGCAAERSAVRACCCWQKKLALAANMAAVKKKSCCKKGTQAAAVNTAPGNCNTGDEHHDTDQAVAGHDEHDAAGGKITASISSCPCGSDKQLLHWGSETIQHLPSVFAVGIPLQQTVPRTTTDPERLISHHGEPPDPPPKISFLS